MISGTRTLPGAFANPLQFARKVTRTLPTVVREFCKAFSYRVIQYGRRQWLGGGDRFRFLLEDRACNTQLALAFECALPVTISYSSAPNEKMSLRPSTSLPSTCSGDMY
jgi:hypothetical protein